MNVQPPASHHIAGAYVEDDAGAVIESRYPATGEVIANLHSATPAIIERGVAAKAAQPAWAALKGVERGRILLRAAEILRARNDEISRVETLDTGKAIQETLVADATSAADALEYFGGIAGEQVELDGCPRQRHRVRPGGRGVHRRSQPGAPGDLAARRRNHLDQHLQSDAGGSPFGGVKQSGIGRENSRAAIEHYTRLKSVYVATGRVDGPD